MSRPLDELLEKALEVPGGPQRNAWIAGLCLDQPDLEAELRELIEAHESAGTFLTGTFPEGEPEER